MTDTPPPASSPQPTRRRPSLLLLAVGLTALVVSVISLAGPTTWNTPGTTPLAWIAVAIAVILGLTLILAPGKRKG